MKKLVTVLYVLMTIAGLAGAILCGSCFVMAVRYGELGRVVVYFTLTVLCIELFAVGLIRLIRGRKKGNTYS